MGNQIFRMLIFILAVFIGLSACKSSFIIENVNFAQPVESVLEPDAENLVNDQRYAVSFSIDLLLDKEGIEQVEALHLIRDREGFYYVTAPGFSSIYIFYSKEGTLKSERDISIPGGRVESPAFNQRGGHIELVDLTSGITIQLNREGIIEEEES